MMFESDLPAFEDFQIEMEALISRAASIRVAVACQGIADVEEVWVLPCRCLGYRGEQNRGDLDTRFRGGWFFETCVFTIGA